MIKPEQIPDVVIEAARGEWLRSDDGAVNDWRNAIAAAINAWPGRSIVTEVSAVDAFGYHHPTHPMTLHLPLPQEKNDVRHR